MQNATKQFVKVLLVLALVCIGCLLAGCKPIIAAFEKAPIATSAPTPVAVTVMITPAARTLWSRLHECALAHPELVLILWERPSTSPDFHQADLSIRLGAPSVVDGYSALLGETEIKVIVNSSSTLQNLTLDEIRTIFQKGITASGQPLQVWILQDDEVRPYFDAVVLNGEEAASQAQIAPDPAAMLAAVSSDPTAIGYLPATWLNDEVRPLVLDLGLDSALSQKLRLPILALAKAEPQGVPRTLLGCLQVPEGAPK